MIMTQRKQLDKDGIELIEWTIEESKNHRKDPKLNQAADSVMQMITIALNLQNNNHDNTKALVGISNAISKYKEQLTRSGYSAKDDPILDILSRNNLTDATPPKANLLKKITAKIKPAESVRPGHAESDPTSKTRNAHPTAPAKSSSTGFFGPKAATNPQEKIMQTDEQKLKSEIKILSDAMNLQYAKMMGTKGGADMVETMIFKKMGEELKQAQKKLDELSKKTETKSPKL